MGTTKTIVGIIKALLNSYLGAITLAGLTKAMLYDTFKLPPSRRMQFTLGTVRKYCSNEGLGQGPTYPVPNSKLRSSTYCPP